MKTEHTQDNYKEVVIVGNGPAGLALSYILSGKHPYYNGGPHPDEMLHNRLQSLSRDESLLQADLESLATGVEGRSRNPLGALFDELVRPGTDRGLDCTPLLEWRRRGSLDHVVVGKGPPGGSWTNMDGDVLTLSLSSWMELPGLPFADWDTESPQDGGSRRVRVRTVASYYSDYVRRMRLTGYQKRGHVTAVRLLKEENGSGRLWRVEGRDSHGRMSYLCRHLVLATGSSDLANRLGVPGEDLPWVYHDLGSLEAAMEGRRSGRVVIVGAGLSAADAILSARFRNLEVHHVFRTTTPLDRILPESLYPEYHKIYQMMSSGGEGYPGYVHRGGSRILSFQDNRILLCSTSGKTSSLEDVDLAAVLIGTRPDLGFLPRPYSRGESLTVRGSGDVHPRLNPIQTDPGSHRATKAEEGANLYVLGPLSGDNFVRYLLGGAAAVASHLYRGAAPE